jgi:hypothetical protein
MATLYAGYPFSPSFVFGEELFAIRPLNIVNSVQVNFKEDEHSSKSPSESNDEGVTSRTFILVDPFDVYFFL